MTRPAVVRPTEAKPAFPGGEEQRPEEPREKAARLLKEAKHSLFDAKDKLSARQAFSVAGKYQ